MPPSPIDLEHPDLVRLTQMLQELTVMFSNGGFQPELREPYREYGTELLGRDLKITHADTPAYYAAIKALASPESTRLVAQSALFSRPGLTVRVWSIEAAQPVPSDEIFQFINSNCNEFRRDVLSVPRVP